MNYSELKEALSVCERYERFSRLLSDLARKAPAEAKSGQGATYRLMEALLKITNWESVEFETYLMPPDILADAIVRAAERVQTSIQDKVIEAKRLLLEGFEVDELGKKPTKKTKNDD
jgi:hypothetical protein